MIPTGEHSFSTSAGIYLNPQDTEVWENPRGDVMPAAGKISSLTLSQVWSHCLFRKIRWTWNHLSCDIFLGCLFGNTPELSRLTCSQALAI